MKTLKLLVIIFFIATGQALISQNFKELDSTTFKSKKELLFVSLKQRFYSQKEFDKNKYSLNEISEFLKENKENYTNWKQHSFSNFTGNVVFAFIMENEDIQKLNSIVYANMRSLNEKTFFSGGFINHGNNLYCILCRSALNNFTFAIVKLSVNNALGEFPTYFESLKLANWPKPNPLFSEINIKEFSYVKNINSIQSNDEFIIYTDKNAIGNYKNLIRYYFFNIREKIWFKATPKTAILKTDTSYHIPKAIIKKSPDIENSPQTNKIISKISKELLATKCDISKIDAIKEEKNILFFVSYKKRCEATALKYNIKKKQWYKVEFEKTEIKQE